MNIYASLGQIAGRGGRLRRRHAHPQPAGRRPYSRNDLILGQPVTRKDRDYPDRPETVLGSPAVAANQDWTRPDQPSDCPGRGNRHVDGHGDRL